MFIADMNLGLLNSYVSLVFIFVILTLLSYEVRCSHIKGTWNTKEFFRFIIKFGVQKTDMHFPKETQGYIFGNISSRNLPFNHNATFAVLPKYDFLEFYGNRSIMNKEIACQRMLRKISTIAYDDSCSKNGTQDYLRRVPCPKDKLCYEEDTPMQVFKGSQFTFHINDKNEPRFWYISLVACYLNATSCQWHHINVEGELEYDIWLVNGNPNASSFNPLVYQFSFDKQYLLMMSDTTKAVLNMLNVFEQTSNTHTEGGLPSPFHKSRTDRDLVLPTPIYLSDISLSSVQLSVLSAALSMNTLLLYLVFFMCYLVLVPLQMYAVTRQRHPVTRLFTASLLFEFVGLSFNLIDVVKYAVDGIGLHDLAVAGDILDILSRTTFMLLLLLLAKGWAVTRLELSWKPLVFTIWFIYGVVHILLYIWNMTEVDIIEDIDEYQTWPGWLILVLRCLIMVWFLLELRNTMLYEHNASKLHFFLHFGASALVWYIYLPIIALIALQVPAFWRFKLLLGITYSADCFAYCIMAHLLWPTRSEQYFLLAHTLDPGDELDEFNEAPHILNSGYTTLRTTGSNQDLSLHSSGSVSDIAPLEFTKVVV